MLFPIHIIAYWIISLLNISTPVSFTFYINETQPINAVKVTEICGKDFDVFTLYYPKGSIYFSREACRTALGYTKDDYIFQKDKDHTAPLHKSNAPDHHFAGGFHCHIKVSKNQVAKSSFLEKILRRHSNKTKDIDKIIYQFNQAISIFKSNKQIEGIIFKDGSFAHNCECKNLKQSLEIDKSKFIYIR